MLELPIIEDTWIQTYQIRNYELGILQDKIPWVYGKYINCYYNPQEEDCFNHCMSAGGRFFINDGVLLGQKFIFDISILSLKLINFIDWVRNFINNRWYVMCYVDEYYIEAKYAYEQYHFRHTVLIYGYDKEAFLAIGYNKDRKYTKFQITFEEFEKALNVNFDKRYEKYYHRNIDKVEFDIVKINPEYDFKLNLKELYISLSDYINSVDSFNSKDTNRVYGIECERVFQDYINNTLNEKIYLDMRYSRLFMELKEIMMRRLEYLAQIKAIPPDYLDTYSLIAKDQASVHMLFMKYNVTKQDDIIKKINAKIDYIIEREEDILPKIRKSLFDYLLNMERNMYY